MPSPFPGMDPWLEAEAVFPPFHERFLLYVCDAINDAVPGGYVATTKNRVWVDAVQHRDPDVSVFESDPAPPRNGSAAVAVAPLPGLQELGEDRPPEPWEEPYLEILSADGERLVTAVEVLSAANKTGGSKGRQAYLDKQEEYRLGGVNVVEIDLLRGGLYTSAVPRGRLERLNPSFSYHVSVVRVARRNQFYGTVIGLADRLPAIGIPLDLGVPPAVVDLQSVLDATYDRGRFAKLVKYHRPCHPPLTAEQQAWADGVLKEKGLRA